MKIEGQKKNVTMPCLNVKMVNIDKIRANNYNPNNVPQNKMQLLYQSIVDNGFCYPLVTIYDDIDEVYVIIDGFHRFSILRDYLEVNEVPIVVLEHDINQRMAATVQFNRARGVHQVELMGDLVQKLIEQGQSDEEISKHLGMDLEEVHRLKQITGIAEIFKNQSYSKSWEMKEVDIDD